MDPRIFIPIVISLLVSFLSLPIWIKKAHQIGLIWPDMHKSDSNKVAGSGGVIMVLAFIVGCLIFIAYRTFYLHTFTFLIEMLALIVVIIFLSGIGFIDDLLGWQRGGLSIRTRTLLILLAALPLAVINAGKSSLSIPLLGQVDFGLFYPLVLVPVGIYGASAAFNMIAGYNGLEAGQGILLLAAIATVAQLTGNSWLALLSLCMLASLLGFLFYNLYPAKVFPGDSLTYAIGGFIAIASIIGNFEKIAVFFFIPYIIEVILKSRGKLRKSSFGKLKKDGTLDMPYDKIYGIEHASIYLLNKTGIMATEKKVVYTIWAFQLLIILVGFYIFRNGIFL